ncbi:hypothetical protein Taro_039266 [Colocasia esculenta]|uniref:Uncharacterized protein n=1 Tax=Colocasia esculenta TaxID=4460 RepID=A0A843W5X7_COLES|nr:hypothetical protein [Colocasia esculenta]
MLSSVGFVGLASWVLFSVPTALVGKGLVIPTEPCSRGSPPYFLQESCLARPWLLVMLFEFIAYLTGLNSNPSGSSDPWVAVRPSGSLAGIREVASFPTGSECELQDSVAAIAGCACYERGCCFARAAVGFVIGLCIRSSSLLVLVEVRFPQNCVVLVSGCCGITLWVEAWGRSSAGLRWLVVLFSAMAH